MRTIPLTRGEVALVDEEDFERLNAFKWQCECRRKLKYASRHSVVGETTTRVFMHRQLLGQGTTRPIDHINGNGLDNRRENLRLSTNSLNQANRKNLTTNTSGYRGVCLHKKSGKWQAAIRKGGKNYYLGLFDDPVEAYSAYRAAAIRLFGEHSALAA